MVVTARITPLSSPPMIRATFMCRKLRTVALETADGGTRSLTIAIDAGAPIVSAIPNSTASPSRTANDGAVPRATIAQDDADNGQGDEIRHEHRPGAEPVGQDARLRHQQQERHAGGRVDQPHGGRRTGHLERVPAERRIEQEDPACRAQHRGDEVAERRVLECGPADAIESRVGPADDLGGRSGHTDHCKSHWMLGPELQCYASS